jgi:hypothetical protein
MKWRQSHPSPAVSFQRLPREVYATRHTGGRNAQITSKKKRRACKKRVGWRAWVGRGGGAMLIGNVRAERSARINRQESLKASSFKYQPYNYLYFARFRRA